MKLEQNWKENQQNKNLQMVFLKISISDVLEILK